jgi:DNA-binding transcriptional regulator GbsR (MarR family)
MCEKFGMEFTPNYDQSHLVVAAVRILAHKDEKSPTMEEIGELLGISHEVIGAVARALDSRGIVKINMTPFDTRVEVADHAALEELPREDTGAAMKEEVDAFLERTKDKQEKIEKLFGEEEYQKRKKKKQTGLEAQLNEFQKKKEVDPFAKPDAGAEEEDES